MVGWDRVWKRKRSAINSSELYVEQGFLESVDCMLTGFVTVIFYGSVKVFIAL